MTDSSITKTAETVLAVAQVLRAAGDSAYLPDVERALREAGLLVSGAPSEEQIERAAKAMYSEEESTSLSGHTWPAWGDLCEHPPSSCECDSEGTKLPYLTLARSALAAAGVGSPVPVQIDETKLAGVINAALDAWQGEERSEVFVAHKIAEWLRGGAQ